MLTTASIQLYQQFKGDLQGFALAATPAQRAQLPEWKWALLLDVMQDMYLVKQGLASAAYVARHEQRLRAHCSGQEVIATLASLA